ncbi:unnamed protein product [Prunus armeniaca]|uniref:Uncharacterized protein n=1 Tax=Prunus armeniaca TaxID=36596 RepID=A0A6J5XBH0_PRUAR|nr:unnamed protein product [Prunus armeniaca]
MPKIWILYLQTLTEQKLFTRTRRTFDRALCALPVTQHDGIWDPYLEFVSQKGIPIETSLRLYRRYLKYDPTHIEKFIEFLINSSLWEEAAERLASVLNDDQFYSIKGKTKHRLWLELCDLLAKHAKEVSGLNVDAIIRGGIRKFTDEVGRLWNSLADYYIRRNLHEKAMDIFEEGMITVVTVRDFSVIFYSYVGFEDSMLVHKMETADLSDEEEEEENGVEEDGNEEEDVDLRLARLEHLMDRSPILASSVLLRQNPHNVEQWHQRVKLFEGNPTKQILTYTEAVRTVDPMKAVGKPHTLWVAFAKLYENHEDIANARVIFDKAVQNFKGALELMRLATAEPSVEVKCRVAADGNQPVQMKLHKSLRMWTFYVDLEESLGKLESTRAVYERIMDLKIATPQIIINYALLLEKHKYFEDAFKVYEKGTKIFKYPHVKDIWVTYLSKFVKRYGKKELERARQLFEDAVQAAPADAKKPLYLQFANLEEDYGLAKRAMKIYDEATKAVPNHEKLSMYEIYIARAAEIFGIPKTREIYEQAIKSGLPDKDVKTMCLKYAELEKSLGEIDCARGVYVFASQFLDPRSDIDFWNKWHEFEAHFILPEYMMQKDQRLNIDEAKHKLKQAGVPEDEMAALERQLAPVAKDTTTKDGNRKVGFVSAGVESQMDEEIKVTAIHEEIELLEESDSEDDEMVEIALKEVPSAVFGELANKRKEAEKDEGGDVAAATKDGDSHLGALERIKRLK